MPQELVRRSNPETRKFMIDVRELRKSFGATAAVRAVSFEVRDGETFGLLGPNGAGKSTTIGMMTGAIRPDGGAIWVNGGHSPSNAATRLGIGFAPQELSLYEEFSAIENLAFFGRLYQLAGKVLDERVRWAIDFAGLADR